MAAPSSLVSGQVTFPTMEDEIGYGAITTTLNPNQERFCWEYILHNGNGSAAYMTAFPSTKRISARANAARLLKNPKIQARIQEIKEELKRRYAVSADSLVLYLSQALNLDRREFLDDSGNPKSPNELDTEAARILDIDFALDRTGKQRAVYRLPTRMQAAVELCRILGLHKDKLEVSKPFESMTDDELLVHAQSLAKKVLNYEE